MKTQYVKIPDECFRTVLNPLDRDAIDGSPVRGEVAKDLRERCISEPS